MTTTDWITQELDQLRAQGLYNTIRVIESPQGAWLTVDGQRVLNFCSNNYLGLANHPRLLSAAHANSARHFTAYVASSFVVRPSSSSRTAPASSPAGSS